MIDSFTKVEEVTYGKGFGSIQQTRKRIPPSISPNDFQTRNIIPGIPHNHRHAVFLEELKIRQVHRQTFPWLNWSRERGLRSKAGRGELYFRDIERESFNEHHQRKTIMFCFDSESNDVTSTAELVDLVRLHHRSHTINPPAQATFCSSSARAATNSPKAGG